MCDAVLPMNPEGDKAKGRSCMWTVDKFSINT